jgi:predicted nucleic acid-binding protein
MKNMNPIFIDANIFTYFLTNHPKYGNNCMKLLERIENGKLIAHISPLVIDEVSYVLMIQKGKELTGIIDINNVKRSIPKIWEKTLEPVEKFYEYLEYLSSLGSLKVLNLDYSISKTALMISKEYGLFPRDALHAACCKAYGIPDIATNDRDFENLEWLNIWKP